MIGTGKRYLFEAALWAAAVIAVVAWTRPAAGEGRPVAASGSGQCLRLIDAPGGRLLLNACGACRVAKVQLRRPGAEAPVSRTYPVPAHARIEISIRGPNQVRLDSDQPCEGPGADAEDRRDEAPRCVQVQRPTQGVPVLVNGCELCRAVVVERVDAGGRRRQQTVALSGRSFAPLAPDGAAYARLVSERGCP